ncbi:SET and MYND domain-containing protein 4-like isoform X2 [Bacillus rossius redtenbacheri]|uniref:SET and MYND domain-containing protein 4-like isoform X2 n=1 Tax=Bacillus rossius redtenbacheri TaxID=93214 RepID=UPI002FDE1659
MAGEARGARGARAIIGQRRRWTEVGERVYSRLPRGESGLPPALRPADPEREERSVQRAAMRAEEDPDPLFTSLCSERTLQPGQKGFFMEYARRATEAVGEAWVRQAVVEPLSHVQSLHRAKSAAVSRQRRADGDLLLHAGHPQRALLLYSQAVVRAPPAGSDMTVDDGLSLALALAARSEALLTLEDYELSVADAQMAVKEGFPMELRYQLYWRMARCYRPTGQTLKARISLQLASRLLTQHAAGVGTEAVLLLVKMDEELAQLEGREGPARAIEPSGDVRGEDRPAACGLMGVASSEDCGRFAVALGSVHAGDTLVAEDALAACLLPDKFGSNCHHCFARLKAPVACPHCSGLAFCSTTCRDEACRSYHKLECRFMDLLIGSGMSILCHVALRLVTQSGLEFFAQRREQIRQHAGPTSKDDKYMEVFNLVTHSDKRSAIDFFQRTLMAIFLLTYLQKAGFFPSTTAKSSTPLPSDDELLVGSVLLRHLQLLQFNAHEVYETHVETPQNFRTGRVVYIGVGIYPTAALFNHDCYPAVTRYFRGRSIVVRAVRPLEPGDVVAENYGPVFTKRPLVARQRALSSRYWFHCACTACKEDWPLIEKLERNVYRLRCSTPRCTRLQNITKNKESYKCPACNKIISTKESLCNIAECEEMYARGLQEMEDGFPEKAIPLFCSYLDAMHKICVPPHKDTMLCQEALRICMADKGNVWISGLQKT